MTAACTVCELHVESTFTIEGMDCRDEVAMLERRFKNLPGLEGFRADVIGRRLHVQYDASKLTASAIASAVADAGMRAWLEHEVPVVTGRGASRTQAILLASAAGWFAGGLIVGYVDGSPTFATICYGASVASSFPLTARKAWAAARQASLDINILMVVATAGAIALGEWPEAASVVFLFAVAQMLEARTLDHARRAVRGLIDLAPTEVLLREGAGQRRVSVELAVPGSIIIVKAGEKFPLDGEVVEGASAVNQAPVTGESVPVDKMPGDAVFAGSINGPGALDVRVTCFRRDTTLARIIHMVEQAQARRAPAQVLIDRFAKGYTPLVVAFAVWVAVIPPALIGGDWQMWLYRALVMLVVSCPCALVISTPVSIVAALAAGARKGVLIKGGAHLERAAQVQCIALDKTGTLTGGTPEVVDVLSVNGAPVWPTLSLAASVEQRSEHPLASAILRYAAANGVPLQPATDVSALAGSGVEGRVDGSTILLGNHRLFEERGLCFPSLHARVEELALLGRTPILVARDQEPIGLIAVADRPRDTAREAVNQLRQQGIQRIVMLTGDSAGTARSIATELGLDEYRAELMPEGKVAAIQELREKYGLVAMVGDGINDAPALASSDLGIAMGAAGSHVALETADVALMTDDLLRIPYALSLSRATVTNIKVNLTIALGMKAAFVFAALFGYATLWMAILADTGASVIVVANALRLLRAK